ncbi:MAG TPA: hypothetical protein VLT33_18730 [Labilithrix sp.]|nr:hypothetical protein [Labilithrix sp.]
MSERPARGEMLSWPDPYESGEFEPGEASPASAEAALVAARNEIALLRARVARLQRDNERLEADLAARSARPAR